MPGWATCPTPRPSTAAWRGPEPSRRRDRAARAAAATGGLGDGTARPAAGRSTRVQGSRKGGVRMTLGTVIIVVAVVTFVALVIGLHYRSGGFRFGCAEPTSPRPMRRARPPTLRRSRPAAARTSRAAGSSVMTVVLITGAAGGLGLETARHLGGGGATVLVHGRNPARCDEAIEDLARDVPRQRLRP